MVESTMGEIYTSSASNSGPDLAEAIEVWLAGMKEYNGEWYVSTSRVSNEEFSKMWPMINPDSLRIGTLSGMGWILKIYHNRIEAFQDFPWGGSGTEKQPLMAADPQFFEKLDTIMERIYDYRIRERVKRREADGNP